MSAKNTEEKPSTEAKNDVKIEAKSKPKRGKKKKGGPKAALLILILLAVVSYCVFGLNLFNIRDAYVMPVLYKIPFLSNYIPKAIPDEVLTEAQLHTRITSLESELENTKRDLETVESTNARNLAEIERLKEFESQQIQFKQDKLDFDEMVAMQDTSAFVEFYERLYPENAAKLYPRAAADSESSGVVQRYIKNFSEMEPENSAAVLERLISTDMELVVSILNDMNSRDSSAILSSMSPDNAASVVKMMSPYVLNTP
jgi:flagellar motility protein MotE (MotC chaperone)